MEYKLFLTLETPPLHKEFRQSIVYYPLTKDLNLHIRPKRLTKEAIKKSSFFPSCKIKNGDPGYPPFRAKCRVAIKFAIKKHFSFWVALFSYLLLKSYCEQSISQKNWFVKLFFQKSFVDEDYLQTPFSCLMGNFAFPKKCSKYLFATFALLVGRLTFVLLSQIFILCVCISAVRWNIFSNLSHQKFDIVVLLQNPIKRCQSGRVIGVGGISVQSANKPDEILERIISLLIGIGI